MLRQLLTKYSHVNWALADQAMVSGVNFLTNILIARYLGIEEFGRFTLVWMVVLFFNSLQLAIIISPMMSIGPKQGPHGGKQYYGTILLHQLIFSSVAFVIILFGILAGQNLFPDWNIRGLALPLASTLVAVEVQDFLRRQFYVRQHGALAFFNDVISYLGQVLVLIILFYYGLPSAGNVLWVIAGTSAIAAIVGLFHSCGLVLSLARMKQVARQHYDFAKWLLGSAILQWTTGNFFLIVAGNLLGPVAVGAIKAAQSIMGVSHVLFQAMENFVPSEATHKYRLNGAAGLKNYINKVLFFGGGLTLGLTVIISFFAKFWLSKILGPDYASFAFVLRWFAPIYIFTFLSLPLSAGIRALEQTKILFISLLVMSVFSLLAAYPLIQYFSIHGAMGGMLVVKIGIAAMLYLDYRRRLSRIGS